MLITAHQRAKKRWFCCCCCCRGYEYSCVVEGCAPKDCHQSQVDKLYAYIEPSASSIKGLGKSKFCGDSRWRRGLRGVRCVALCVCVVGTMVAFLHKKEDHVIPPYSIVGTVSLDEAEYVHRRNEMHTHPCKYKTHTHSAWGCSTRGQNEACPINST